MYRSRRVCFVSTFRRQDTHALVTRCLRTKVCTTTFKRPVGSVAASLLHETSTGAHVPCIDSLSRARTAWRPFSLAQPGCDWPATRLCCNAKWQSGAWSSGTWTAAAANLASCLHLVTTFHSKRERHTHCNTIAALTCRRAHAHARRLAQFR